MKKILSVWPCNGLLSRGVLGEDALMVNPTIIRGANSCKGTSVLGADALYVRCVLSEDTTPVFMTTPTNNRGVNHGSVVLDDFLSISIPAVTL